MDRETLIKELKELGEQEINYRTSDYTGIGRPKKSDYIQLKRKDLRDYRCFELLNNGLSTNYTY